MALLRGRLVYKDGDLVLNTTSRPVRIATMRALTAHELSISEEVAGDIIARWNAFEDMRSEDLTAARRYAHQPGGHAPTRRVIDALSTAFDFRVVNPNEDIR